MNARHLAAILCIRWQMMRHQFRKSVTSNRILTIIVIVLTAISSIGLFVFTAVWGSVFLAKMEPFYVIYVWDALAIMFLFGWAVSLMIELQQSEMLSLKNLLHLPVSLRGAFFLNYTSSLASLIVWLFLPVMLGLCVASISQYGIKSIVSLALVTSFVFMVTAVSYQLRGWLARLMENKRRRGTVIAVTTIVFVLIFQIPTIVNMGAMESLQEAPRAHRAAHEKRIAELDEQREAGEIDGSAYAESVKSAMKELRQQQKADRKARNAADQSRGKSHQRVVAHRMAAVRRECRRRRSGTVPMAVRIGNVHDRTGQLDDVLSQHAARLHWPTQQGAPRREAIDGEVCDPGFDA